MNVIELNKTYSYQRRAEKIKLTNNPSMVIFIADIHVLVSLFFNKKFIRMTFSLLVMVLSLFFNTEVYGQEATDFALPSPNAASLGKYGEVPVSEYTGIPNISVPLYKTEVGGNPFVISVSYHAQGVKVNEIASSVGQNWSLNAGGAIIRTIRGKADELPNGFFDSGYVIKNYDEINDFTPQQRHDVIHGNFDTNPDVFSFNFMGKAGKFVYRPTGDGTGEFISIPLNDYKISFTGEPGWYIDTWTITDEAGVEYKFTEKEASTSIDKKNGGAIVPEGPTAWYLTSVTFPGGNHITFDYSSPVLVINYDELTYKEKVEFPVGATHESNIQTKTKSVYLSKITTDKEEIFFNKASRDDHEYEKKYSSIEIKRNNSRLKKILFNHSYWSNGTEYHQKRLKLDGVKIQGETSADSQQYQFEYYPGDLPSRDSYATDHWGFYNGKDRNADILPEMDVPFPSGHHSEQKFIELPGADKDPDPSFSDNGLLKKITWPTGGYTEFEYEGNTYGYRSNEELEVISERGTTLRLHVKTEKNGKRNGDTETADFTVPTTQHTEISTSFIPVFNMPEGEVAMNTDLRVRLVDENGNEIFEERLHIPDDSNLPPPPYSPERTRVLLKKNVTYTLELEAWGDYDQGNVGIPIFNKLASVQEKKGGGNRIRRIKSHDGIDAANDIIKTYTYRDSDNNDRSSGAVISEPHYHQWVNLADQSHLIRYSASSSLIGPQGVHVGYKNVKVAYGENEGKGYSLLTFDGIQNLPSFKKTYAPFAVIDTYDWDVGQLVKKEDYDGSNNIIQSKTNEFNRSESYAIRGAVFKRLLSISEYNHNLDPYSIAIATVIFFDHTTANKRLEKSTTRLYNSDTNYVETSVEYEYKGKDHGLVTKQIDIKSNDDTRLTEYLYAHEENKYRGMKEKNMLTQPYKVTTKDGSGDIVNINWTLWKLFDVDGTSTDYWQPCGQWTGGPALGTSAPSGC